MTVFWNKARERWQYEFQQDRVRHSKFCFTPSGAPATSKREAMAAEAEAKKRAKIGPKLPRAADLTVAEIFNALCDGWINTHDWRHKQRIVKELIQFFGAGTPVREIDGARLQDYFTFAVTKLVMVWAGGKRDRTAPENERYWKPHPKRKCRANSSINQHLPVMRAFFARAYATRDSMTGQRAIDEVPVIKELPEPMRKAHPVPDDVLTEVQGNVPEYVREAIIATLYFGFRKSEAFGLQIHHVDFLANGIRLDHTEVKNRQDSFLPGGAQAMEFMAGLVAQAKARKMTYLFTWQRHYSDPARQAKAPWMRVKDPKRSWATVMKRIEKTYGKRWRWHDIRAAFITHVAITMGGMIAQRLARHAHFDTTQGYIDVDDEMMRAGAERASDRPALAVLRGRK
jgi:integrase